MRRRRCECTRGDPERDGDHGHAGQPNQSCEEQPTGPPGFNTDGFANAQQRYANKEGTPAVSQYDVACFQLSQPHPGP
jgi:hypothetical protein